MNKRYLNSILILFLVAIWGSVVYKFFVKKTIVVPEHTIAYTNSNIDYGVKKDTFTLRLNNRNPFKVSSRRTITKTNSSHNVKTSKKTNSTKKMVWPRIEYYGFVKGEGSQTKKVYVKVNGRKYRKRENQNIEALRIVKAYSDSIVVSLNNENKTIQRK